MDLNFLLLTRQAAGSGGFRGWGGIRKDSCLLSSCLLAMMKTLLAKEIVSEGSGFGFGLANLRRSFFLDQN